MNAAQEGVLTLPDFLSAEAFRSLQVKEEVLAALEYRSTSPLRRGAAVSHVDARGSPLEAFFEAVETCDVPGLLAGRTGLRLSLVPLADPNRLSLLSSSRPGDHIQWHLDGNAYLGDRWVGILVLMNRGPAGVSDAALQFRQGGAVVTANTQENSLVLFQGDRIWHRVTSLGENQRRLVLSMVLCDSCVPKRGLFARLYRALVNLCFYGHT